jgi:Uma2 family endonuclease
MSAQPHTTMTPEEYLAFEERSADKYEYYGGIVVALAGGNQAHSIICSNLNAILHNQLRKRPCTVYTSDMKVKAERPRKYMYPDLSIACGQSVFEDTSRRVLLNPIVIIEVLSESTEKHDRGKKFQYYRSIESVQEYVLVAQDAKQIDRYQRQANNLWLLSSVDVEDEDLYLPSIDCTLVIEDVYEKVPFDAEIDPNLQGDNP